jgi:AraC family transcriptional regulator of adaptative response / DNA-3-methyladenine glycosylase II
VQSRDPRFDGWFFIGVTSTGLYCRPSCPATTPKRSNVRFFATSAAAQEAGFRSCKRCRPDATPGSPEWDTRADAVGRAMRLIRDGIVDREGVAGLASRLGYSPRHLHRLLVAEAGAGPQALARAQRAQNARILAETTDLPFGDIAFASGFGSIRQFNDTVRAVFDRSPGELRHAGARHRNDDARHHAIPGAVPLRLAFRRPFAAGPLLEFLALRAVTGVEEVTHDRSGAVIAYRRTLDLPHGPATVTLTPHEDHVACTLRLTDTRDLTAAVARCRRLLDLDADPVAVDAHLRTDPVLAPLVKFRPGVRVPGAVDGFEIAVRAVVGQQVSVPAAITVITRLTAQYGKALTAPDGALTHLFPSPGSLAGIDPDSLPMPRSRAQALAGLATAVAEGCIDLDAGTDRDRTRALLRALAGVGPWTEEDIALRALRDPDAFPATDLGVRRALDRLAGAGANTPSAISARAAGWRPWRAYATIHLWSTS